MNKTINRQIVRRKTPSPPETLLREQRIKLTPQRLAVYTVLSSARVHLSVDEVYRAVKENLPGLSLATVYAILENFEANGLVREILINGERSFYEARRDSHHHFLCKKCRRIFDIQAPMSLTLKSNLLDGHRVEDFQGNFFGICRECDKK